MITEKTYDIYLVPNGRRNDFARGILGTGYPDACECWGIAMTPDECRQRIRQLADENFRTKLDEHCYTAIMVAAETAATDCGLFSEDQAREIGEAAADKALAIYVDECTAGSDPLSWGLEWDNDLKFVMVRETPAEEDAE